MGSGNLPSEPGTYILLIELSRRRRIGFGRREPAAFEPGWYAYVGSALGGLEARIARHLRPATAKRAHWHIDALLGGGGKVREVYVKRSAARAECASARVLGAEFTAVEGFGASDCGCRSHLFFSPQRKPMVALLASPGLGFVAYQRQS